METKPDQDASNNVGFQACSVMAGPIKVTPEQRVDIYRRKAEGESGKALAREYGLSLPYVKQLTRGARPRLTAQDIAELTRRRAAGESVKLLAAEYKITTFHVYDVTGRIGPSSPGGRT